MRIALLLTPIFLLLCACAPDFVGPIAIPEEYSAEPIRKINEISQNEELQKLQKIQMEPYRISPEDRFQVSVYGNPDLSVEVVTVTPDGLISIPLIGTMKIGGLTLEEAERSVNQKLARYIKSPQTALIPRSVSGFTFTISGMVFSPGKFLISNGQTRIIDAVAMAKGLSTGLYQGTTVTLADLDNAYIIRNGIRLPVNFNKALLLGDPLHNIPLKNGDYIYIPQAMGSTVALVGEVKAPTYVGYREGMTLLGAMPFCRGLQDTHNPRIKIIRGGLARPVVYTLNIDRMLNGKIQDFPLRPNDIVYVPKDEISDWNVLVRKVLPTLQGLSMLAGPFGNPSDLYEIQN